MSSMRRVFPLVAILFAASGCSALIYEIVWFQLLEFVIGSTAVAMGLLLATYMGGLCLGSIALPRIVSAKLHPLRVYAALELGIGISGMAVLLGFPLLRGWPSALCLLPPTLLMGASLPAIARWVESTPKGVSWLGFLYGANIAGAVLGCLAAGFYLLRFREMATASVLAAAINTGVALIAFVLSFVASGAGPLPAKPEGRSWTCPTAIYVAIALSGVSALGAEVIWTRLLALMLGATVYTFSIILAVFLTGLGIGSAIGSWLSRRIARPRIALGWCQMLLAAGIAWTAFLIARAVPYWGVPVWANPWTRFRLDFVHCLGAILPAACLWGASFPLALAAAARREQDPGRLAGSVYAANTAGAIVGALAFSLLLIPGFGTQHSERLLIAVSLIAGVFALGLPLRVPTAVSAILAALLAWSVPAVPWGIIAYGRQVLTQTSQGKLLYVGEGRNSSVAVSQVAKARFFHVSGKVEASNQPQDLSVERMLGHIPALFHPKPRSVLVVGCGAGVTAGSFVPYPEVERIVICEIEPLVPRVVAQYFSRENYDVVRDRRTEVVYDDARHYILTAPDKFDIITSDPIHPWVKGSATLYTKEYFELVKRHLNPGGLVTQWVPLYESTPDTVKSEIATFFEVFPGGSIWANEDFFSAGYDVVLLGQAGPQKLDIDAIQERLSRPDHASVARSLKDVGFTSALGLLSTYAGQKRDLRSWLANAQINRDRNLRLQYLAGMAPQSAEATSIYETFLWYRTFPENLLAGSDQRMGALKKMLGLSK